MKQKHCVAWMNHFSGPRDTCKCTPRILTSWNPWKNVCGCWLLLARAQAPGAWGLEQPPDTKKTPRCLLLLPGNTSGTHRPVPWDVSGVQNQSFGTQPGSSRAKASISAPLLGPFVHVPAIWTRRSRRFGGLGSCRLVSAYVSCRIWNIKYCSIGYYALFASIIHTLQARICECKRSAAPKSPGAQ